MSKRTDDEHLYVRKYNRSDNEITAEDVASVAQKLTYHSSFVLKGVSQ